MDKTGVSFRIPLDLLEKIDDEAKQRKRSRAFIIIEKIETVYDKNHNQPTAPKRQKAKTSK
jgi:hypothetical protein